MSSTPQLGFTLTNPSLQKGVIEVGKATSLDVVLTNLTGGPIGLTNGTSTLTVWLPTFFTGPEVQAMAIQLPGWTFTADAAGGSLTLTCAASTTWADSATITFTITGVTSSSSPDSQTVQINPAGMTGNLPPQVEAPLVLEAAPSGKAWLTDVIQVNLDNQGVVYRSESTDALTNSLFLNIKNISAAPLYSGSAAGRGNPQVIITFVYGNTAGALAPDTNNAGSPPAGSAWNIVAGVSVATAPWVTTNPDPKSQQRHPNWLLDPTPTNLGVLGANDQPNANITFEFKNVISFTPVGHTQMVLLFTGFRKDDSTPYDDHVFVLDIVKQDAPPTRGLLAFASPTVILPVTDPKAKVTFDLRWTMFDVDKVQVVTSLAGLAPIVIPYPNPQPIATDGCTITGPPLSQSEPIFVTAQAFDGNGGFLNSMQFVVYAEVSYVLDPAGRAYGTALIGDTFWMTENYAYSVNGSYAYNGDPANGVTYGLMYTQAAAADANTRPSGWMLPSNADWAALINVGGNSAFAFLTAGSFGALMGGMRDTGGAYTGLTVNGFYLSADAGYSAELSARSSSVYAPWQFPNGQAASVRYIRKI
jgi:uncharacterized protein (TIGR02145 family)